MFVLSGGAIVSNLDYSFTVDREDGTEPVEAPTPGGGGPRLRSQLAFLKGFVEGFDFLRMAPAPSLVAGGLPGGAHCAVLAEPGRQYALYLDGGRKAELALELPAGSYELSWLDPRDGRTLGTQALDHKGGRCSLQTPPYEEDLAVRIKAR